MFSTKSGIFVVSLLSLALAGCGSSRFSPAPAAPPPLTPAPSGTVSNTPLPPPSSPTAPNAFPEAPSQTTDVAALEPGAPGAGPALMPSSVAGVWNVNVAGQNCRVATPQTKFGQGYRAGPLRCPAPLDGVKSWNVQGSQLTLYNENGDVVARLSSTGSGSFSGQTSMGQPISLSR